MATRHSVHPEAAISLLEDASFVLHGLHGLLLDLLNRPDGGSGVAAASAMGRSLAGRCVGLARSSVTNADLRP